MSQALLKGKGRRGIRSRVRFKRTLKRRVTKIERKLRAAIELDAAGTLGTLQTNTLNATPIVIDILATIDIVVTEGFKILLKSFQLNAEVRQNLTSALSDNWRVDLVLDKKPTGIAAITPLIVYGDATPDITALPVFTKRDRFSILRTWRGLLNESTNIGKVFGGIVRVNKMMVTAAEGNYLNNQMQKNNLIMFMWTTATANQPSVSLHFQVIFENAA